MFWLAHLLVSLLAATADYAWFFGSESSVSLMAHANCRALTPSCIRAAKAAGTALSVARKDAYWCEVREQADLAEKVMRENEDRTQAISTAFRKASMYDVLIKNPPSCHITMVDARQYHTTNNFVNPTFVSECTQVPELPGVKPNFDQEMFFGPRRTRAERIVLGAVFVLFAAFCSLLFCCCRLCWPTTKPSAPGHRPAETPLAANTPSSPSSPSSPSTPELAAPSPVHQEDVDDFLEEARPSEEQLAYEAHLLFSPPSHAIPRRRRVESPAPSVESNDDLPPLPSLLDMAPLRPVESQWALVEVVPDLLAISPSRDLSPERPLEPSWAIEDVRVPSSPPPSSYPPSPAGNFLPPSPALQPSPGPVADVPLAPSPLPIPPLLSVSSPLSSLPDSPQPPSSPLSEYERDEQDDVMEALLEASSPLQDDSMAGLEENGEWGSEDDDILLGMARPESESESEEGVEEVEEVEEEEAEEPKFPSPSPLPLPATMGGHDNEADPPKRVSAEVAATRTFAPLRRRVAASSSAAVTPPAVANTQGGEPARLIKPLPRRAVAANTAQASSGAAAAPAVAVTSQPAVVEVAQPRVVFGPPPVAAPRQPRVEALETPSTAASRPVAPAPAPPLAPRPAPPPAPRPAPRPAAPQGGGGNFLSSLLNEAKNPVHKQPGQ